MKSGISRRVLLAGAANLAPLGMSGKLPAFAQNAKGPLVVASWGGSYQAAQKKAFFDPFAKTMGVEIVEATTEYGKLEAMVNSGNVEWDVVDVEMDFVYRAAKKNLLQKLDYAAMGLNSSQFLPGTLNEYGMGSLAYSTVLAWNTKKLASGQRPKDWSDFWDTTKFPGPRTLSKYINTVLEIALLADGVSPETLYPLDVDRGFRSLDRIKPNVTVWWESAAKGVQLLVDGEVAMGALPNGRVQQLIKDGAPLDFIWNQGIIQSDAWVIPRGAKHADIAMKFITFASSPQQQAELTKYIEYGVPNKDAAALMAPSVDLPTTPKNFAAEIALNSQWWVDHYDAVNERFLAWLLK